jgi:hypothetical protein
VPPFGRRYNDDQREAIYRLKCEGHSGRVIADACARGVRGLEPFEIGGDTANRIAREERQASDLAPLARGDLDEGHEEMVRRTVSLIARRIESMERARRPVDVMDLKRLTDSLCKLKGMLAKSPNRNGHRGNGHPEPSWLERLAAEDA